MSALGEGALVVLAVVSLLWTVVLIPVLLDLRRASWRLQEFIRTLELDLRPMLHEAREGMRNVNKAAQGVADGTARLSGAMTALEEAGENVRVITGVFRSLFGSRLIPVVSLLAGVRAALKVLWKRYPRRREPS